MRLSEEAVQAVNAYISLRYSHWSPFQRHQRRRQTVRALKRSKPEGIEEYVSRVSDFLNRNGTISKPTTSFDEAVNDRNSEQCPS